MTPPATYELQVEGYLDDHWSDWLGDLRLLRNGDGTTTLIGPVVDQAELQGLLARLGDLGATLLSLRAHGRTERPADRPALDGPVRTERLTLRPATALDASATFGYRRLERVGRWLTEVPTDLAAYRRTFEDPGRLAATVVVELDGQVVGDLMLRIEDAWAQAEVAEAARATRAELGWVLDPAYTGHGYATEAVRELIRLCFEDLGLRRVVATCFADNDASWRLMERLGMRRELHALADARHRCGTWSDTLGYALLAEEWPPDRGRPGRGTPSADRISR